MVMMTKLLFAPSYVQWLNNI